MYLLCWANVASVNKYIYKYIYIETYTYVHNKLFIYEVCVAHSYCIEHDGVQDGNNKHARTLDSFSCPASALCFCLV